MENELEKKDCPLSQEDGLMEPAPVSCPAPEDELSLLRSIRAELVEQNASSGRKIRLLRGCLIAFSLIALVAVVAAATLLPSLYHMVDNINVTVNALDMQRVDEILGDVQVLAGQSTAVISGMDAALAKINGLDFNALNETIIALEKTVRDFSKLDIETLNTAIANLNETVEPLAKFFAALR